ncbi:hypothetical protein CRENBAI_020762 [Crenichthys baileyi]|uniref:Uncharacterized protein n=1 Tax=Crenichthys baileyi TaxID=28760 RepID=A0AAV9QZX0_9TELE
MGRFGIQNGNAEEQMVVDFAKRMEMAVKITFFQKRQGHRVTYRSGGGSTQEGYILCRCNLKELRDCKVGMPAPALPRPKLDRIIISSLVQLWTQLKLLWRTYPT